MKVSFLENANETACKMSTILFSSQCVWNLPHASLFRQFMRSQSKSLHIAFCCNLQTDGWSHCIIIFKLKTKWHFYQLCIFELINRYWNGWVAAPSDSIHSSSRNKTHTGAVNHDAFFSVHMLNTLKVHSIGQLRRNGFLRGSSHHYYGVPWETFLNRWVSQYGSAPSGLSWMSGDYNRLPEVLCIFNMILKPCSIYPHCGILTYQ